ncbi:C40 family peptidase [Cohnella yongneupensis]|uniref:C40 family peptidase n=1 Tax=Cohnella yongneupensis TaxID=425006 RepID=A0ABW0QX17_9BACL
MGTRKLLTIAALAALLSGCASNPDNTVKTRDLKPYSGPVKVQSNDGSPAKLTEEDSIVPIKTIDHTDYVALEDLTKAIGYHGKWLRSGSFGVGDTDPSWLFRTGESQVKHADQNIKMPAPAVKEGNKLYVPVTGLKPLFGSVTDFAVESKRVAFFPRPTMKTRSLAGHDLAFKDDPLSAPMKVKPPAGGPRALSINSNSDRDDMIDYAEKYLGIKYDFGAEPYSKSGTFDCSTFVQHVYGHFGYDMPRLARQQAKEGKQIDRDSLKKGDLLFFFVPGRFKTKETVGHVGIYYGDGKMIHSCPKPKDGVQITDINKPYWQDTFMFAKRNF